MKIRSIFERSAALLLLMLVALYPAHTRATAGGNGWFPNPTCDDGDTAASSKSALLSPGDRESWCPGTAGTQSQVFRVSHFGAFHWNGDTTGAGAGTVTLSVYSCSGEGTPANVCKTPMVDSSGVPWVVTSNNAASRFIVEAGTYYVVASDVCGNCLLLGTGYY
jgi:hypothetical protein